MINHMKLQQAFLGSFSSAVIFSANAALASGGTEGEGWQMPDNPGGLPEDFKVSLVDITDWLLGLVVLLSVLVIIYGGVIYVFSSGDEDRVRTAKKTIKYAIMGLVMAGLAYAIVTVVIKNILVAGNGNGNTQNTENNAQNGANNNQGEAM